MKTPSEKILAEWFWTDRWTGSSAFLLPLGARGLYREMLTQAWRRGARLPNDHEAIRRACGVTEAEWVAEWPRVEKYWEVQGDWIVNETQVEVYEEAMRRLGTRAKGGKKRASAAPRTGGRFVPRGEGASATHQLTDQQQVEIWTSDSPAGPPATSPAIHQPPSLSPSPSLSLSPSPDQGRSVKVDSTATDNGVSGDLAGRRTAFTSDSPARPPAIHQLDHQRFTSKATSDSPARPPADGNKLDALSDRTATATDPWKGARSLTPASLGIRTNPANYGQLQLAHDLVELVKVRIREAPDLDPVQEARALLAEISTTAGKGVAINSLDLSRVSTEWATISSHAARKLAAEVYGVELEGRDRGAA